MIKKKQNKTKNASGKQTLTKRRKGEVRKKKKILKMAHQLQFKATIKKCFTTQQKGIKVANI